MEQLLKRIKRLVKYLPKSVIKYADKHIEDRQFDRLLEVVDSDIYLVSQNELLTHPKEEYTNISIEELLDLKDAIEEYMSYLVLDND